MKQFIKLLAVVFVLTACASTPKKANNLRPYEEVVLPNGLYVLFIDDQTLPIVDLSLMVKAGSSLDSFEKSGLSAITHQMMSEGTKKRTAKQQADDFAFLGTALGASSGLELNGLSTEGLVHYKDQLLELFADAALNPRFDARDFSRVKAQSISLIKKSYDNAGLMADQTFDQTLFGKSGYGLPRAGTVDGLGKVTLKDVEKFYATYYRPNNSMLAVAGQLTPEFKEKVKSVFGAWVSGQIPPAKISEVKNPEKTAILFSYKKDLKQAEIRIGQAGIARNHPDYLALRAANVVLGGAFASRLNQRVRDDLGLTYSIYSGFNPLKQPGDFSISTFTRFDKVAETLTESKKVLEQFVVGGITEEELNAAKSLMIGQFPALIESADALAGQMLLLRFHGISPDYLRDFNKNVSALKLSDVNAAVKRQIKPEQMLIVVYGEKSAVEKELKEVPLPMTEQQLILK